MANTADEALDLARYIDCCFNGTRPLLDEFHAGTFASEPPDEARECVGAAMLRVFANRDPSVVRWCSRVRASTQSVEIREPLWAKTI